MDQEGPARPVAVPAIVPVPDLPRHLAASRLPAPLSPFVGRGAELREVCALLGREQVRLLTLTGPGGVGKTRLAIQAADTLAAAFPDGVAFVSLECVREPELTLSAIHQALGGRESGSDLSVEQFHPVLGDRKLLLALDNFEQLTAAATNLTTLLAAFPRLKILVTSRVALRLSAEHEYLVPPLTLPWAEGLSLGEEVSWSEALQLFVQRARAARPDLALTGDELAAAGEICRQLDGLPLAIELAAARIDHLSPQAILSRLDSPGSGRLPLLTRGRRDQPARQQTMRDTIAWSYALLDEREQEIFRQLSVFVDGFTAAAACAVCDLDELAVLDGIALLVAKSLICFVADGESEPRYRLYETIREFGLEQLAASSQEEAVRRRHAGWCLSFVASITRSSPLSLDGLEREHANLRAALAWFHRQRQAEPLLRLAAALCSFWEERAHYVAGRHWLEAAIALSEQIQTAERLAVLTSAGTMAWLHNDFPHAVVRHGQALALSRTRGDRKAEAFALNNLGAQAMELGQFAEACRQFAACIDVALAAGALEMKMCALHNLGQLRRMQFDSVTAMKHMEEAHALARGLETRWIVPNLLNGLCMGALDLGDPGRSDKLLRQALHIGRERGSLSEVIDSLEGLARVYVMVGDATLASRLFAAAEVQRERLSTPMSWLECAYFGRAVEQARAALGDEFFAAAWTEGRALSIEAAAALVLASPLQPRARPADGRRAYPAGTRLTDRELEILRHIARGLSTRELSDLLFISPATAARHVANIYNKLGIDSRAQATAYAHQHGLMQE